MIIEVNGKRVEVEDSFASLSKEEQMKTVDEIAKTLIPVETKKQKESGGFMGFLGAALPVAVGGSVDLVNLIAGRAKQEAMALGKNLGSPNFRQNMRESLAQPTKPLAENPFMGTESMRKMMSSVGAPLPSRAPETLPEFIGQFAGETLTSLPIMLRGAQILSAGKGVSADLGKSLLREATERPVRFAAVEGGASVGGGIARAVGQNNELGPVSQAVLEVVGASAGGVAPLVAPLNLGIAAVRRSGLSVFPFTEAGAMNRASKRVRELVDDPVKQAAAIEDLKSSNLMPSAATENPGLMALENAVLRTDPSRSAQISKRNAETTKKLIEQIRISGKISNTRNFVAAKRERLLNALDARVEQAADNASETIFRLNADPNAGQINASLVVRQQLEGALADAKVQEAMLWAAIPQDAKVPVRNIVSRYKTLFGELASSQIEDMPMYVTRAVQIIKERKIKATTVREFDGLYKKLGEVATASRASGDRNKARIAEEMRESIWTSIGNAEGGPEVREAVDTARNFSKLINEKFRRGTVGKILTPSREGGPLIAPEMTLDVAVQPRRRGVLNVKALQEASESPLIMEGVQDYLKAQFVRNVLDNGRVSPPKANSFFRQNAELLDAMPALKEQLQAARTSEDVVRRVARSTDAFRRALDRQEISATARFLNAPVDQEIDRLMTSADPSIYFKRIINASKKDNNQEAINGLKAGFSEWLIKNSTSPNSVDIVGNQNFNGMRLRNLIKEERVASSISSLFTKAEINNLTKLADLLAKIQRQSIGAQAVPIISDRPSRILEIAGRMVGAKFGSQVSSTPGGSLQSAGIASSAVKNFMNRLTAEKATKLLTDAVDNPDLMVALLRHEPTLPVSQRAVYERSIRAYLLGPGGRLVDAETKELLQEEKAQEMRR